MNILIPLDSGNQFILFYIRHPLLVDKEKEKYTKRDGDNTKQYTKRFVTEHPIYTGIIKTVQCVILYRVIEFKRKPFPFSGMNTCPIDQQIKHRKKHNTGKIRNHQSHCNRKSLIIEDSSGNTTHKNQWSKHGNGSQVRT